MGFFDSILSLFGNFWAGIEEEFRPPPRMMWRLSVFVYDNYEEPPYYTYWRGTMWFDHKPEGLEVLNAYEALAEEASRQSDNEVKESPRIEIEQIYEGEMPSGYDGSLWVSRSDGGIPAEDYTGFRQTRLDADFNDDLEDSGEW